LLQPAEHVGDHQVLLGFVQDLVEQAVVVFRVLSAELARSLTVVAPAGATIASPVP